MNERLGVCPTKLRRNERHVCDSDTLDIQRHIKKGDAIWIEVESGPGYLFIVRDLVEEGGYNFPVGDLISGRFCNSGTEGRIKSAVLACGIDSIGEYTVLARGLRAEFATLKDYSHVTPPIIDCYFTKIDRLNTV